ncbi:MAG TPA: patatin-like phospholipase family protein [Nitrososphaeraceae archaeon]|nr:patatin-like phospholipase family protein [Nitrososphaeraceae archaeon]
MANPLNPKRDTNKNERVLIMQGGGSLGAYECGVYKAFTKHNIRFDIVAGTSIGAVNAAIIVGSNDSDPSRNLEEFWLTVAEKTIPSFIPDKLRSELSVIYGFVYGNKNIFQPRWSFPPEILYYYFNSPFLYDIKPLKETLTKFVNFDKINEWYRSQSSSGSAARIEKAAERREHPPRLIMTCTDIKKGESVRFDSDRTEIDAGQVIACTGYPFYAVSWVEKNGQYLWDGSLLSNTPLKEVYRASPSTSKLVYIANLFPKTQTDLPSNLFGAWHRARDILFSDKTTESRALDTSKVLSKCMNLIRQTLDLLGNNDGNNDMRQIISQIEEEYQEIVSHQGLIVEDMIQVERTERIHYLFEDADFSFLTIKELIRQGEADAEKVLREKTPS